ncbi:hypothetical protein HCU74_05590 [Spongiibacter sp. KMU-166]|uniref:PH domain-containing protein n=1 Tax=Spongiibacter thalassae TaxID=2721624 RepID=A0ABX1GCL2_9GAMM|nr:hypothetical protein [Spongiibacter thalassae]NKI16892.1 hypothetical protein [Spongiibacter thalassae]
MPRNNKNSEAQGWLNSLHKMRVWAKENNLPIQYELTVVRKAIAAQILADANSEPPKESTPKPRKKKPFKKFQLKQAEKIKSENRQQEKKPTAKVYRKLPLADSDRKGKSEDALDYRISGSFGHGKRSR